MFGFLRRKKPDASAATTVSTPATGQTDDPTAAPEPAATETLPVQTPAAASPEQPARGQWMGRLKNSLGRTRKNLTTLFTGAKIDEDLYEELETALLSCDAGFHVTEHLLTRLRTTVREQKLQSGEQVRTALADALLELLDTLEGPLDIDKAQPLVMMIAGVNGAGKTTSIGKLANHLQKEGKSILLAAGDTFRAAAREQLQEWGSRNNVQVIAQESGDPAAVAFDSVKAGIARNSGVVMIDTAGRLPTQANLMQELTKIKRVLVKSMDGAPHEVILVLDGNTGQNMLAQVQAFDEAVGLTGLIVTKLDGTAKGGALAALAYARRDKPLPVYFIGIGEGLEDLQAFSAREFTNALIG